MKNFEDLIKERIDWKGEWITDEEEESINKNHIIKNFSDIHDKPWSAEYHVNMSAGKKPYIKKNGIYVEVDGSKTIPKNVEYLEPDKVKKYNLLATEINRLQGEQDNIMNK